MTRRSFTFVLGLAIAALVFGRGQSALAIKPFKDAFDKKYVKDSPANAEETALKTAVEAAKCNTCHVPGKDKKKFRNPYGEALAELLDAKKDKKDLDKINLVLDMIAKQPSKPDDATSPTFGDLIKQGKLPGGDLPADAGEDKEAAE